jgi:hypothetical protein
MYGGLHSHLPPGILANVTVAQTFELIPTLDYFNSHYIRYWCRTGSLDICQNTSSPTVFNGIE